MPQIPQRPIELPKAKVVNVTPAAKPAAAAKSARGEIVPTAFFAAYAFFQLLSSGVIVALSGVNGEFGSIEAWLSTAVNAVACCHYYQIYQARRSKEGDESLVVDVLRYSDWIVTLPLMAHELRLSVTVANQASEFYLPSWSVSVLAGFTVFFGGVWKFYCRSCRKPRTPDQIVIGTGAFAASCVCFLLVTVDLLNGLGPIESAARRWLAALTVAWYGYPVVALARRTDKVSETISDFCFAALDTFTKGGLALYAAGVIGAS
ncbi:MAG: hypothetical protein CMM02_00645 [Rhodopirellula sp.]|nr:hypothetical protein [Rhodopirellula sp.]